MDDFKLEYPPRRGEESKNRRYTPAWCTELLLDHCPPPAGDSILDPAAGFGAILRVCKGRGYAVLASEIREECMPPLRQVTDFVWCEDWLDGYRRWDAPTIIANPPYSIGVEFMRCCMLTQPPYCAALLRLNHLGSATWANFWREYPPDMLLFLASKRPSFSADGKTDASEYCWCIWGVEKGLVFV